jgi:hypothetical protein
VNALPKLRPSITSRFTEELMESSDFVAEAITEECDFPALIRGLQSGDAIGVRDEIERACEKYAAFLLDHPDYDETRGELETRLRKAYR